MARVQVEDLRVRTPSQPTARVVDTYVRPEAPSRQNRAAQIAEAFSSIAPGVVAKANEEKRKEELLKAERAFLVDGAAEDVNNLLNGDAYAQESKIFLQHYKELRAKAYVQNQLNTFEDDLQQGRITDDQGNPLIIESSSQFNNMVQGKISELTQSLGQDPLIFDTVVPAINEWRHNATVSFEAGLDKKLRNDRELAFLEVGQGIVKKLPKLGMDSVAAELTLHADEYYALSKDPQTNAKVVNELLGAMNTTGNLDYGRLALKLQPGGRPLSNTLQSTIVDGMKAIQREQTVAANAQAKATEDARKKRVTEVKNKAFEAFSTRDADANPYQILKSFGDELVAAGGERDDLLPYVEFSNKRFEFQTQKQEQDLTSAQADLFTLAQDPSREVSVQQLAMDMAVEGTYDIHPDSMSTLLNYARSLEKSSSILANPEVGEQRELAVSGTIGRVMTGGRKFKSVQQEKRIADEFDRKFTLAYAEAFQADGQVTPAESRAIASQVANDMIAVRQADDELKLKHSMASEASLAAANEASSMFSSVEDVEDVVVAYPEGEDINSAYEFFMMGTFQDPMAPVPGNEDLTRAEQFDQLYGPGAFAYFLELENSK